jgi:hypothetical protein
VLAWRIIVGSRYEKDSKIRAQREYGEYKKKDGKEKRDENEEKNENTHCTQNYDSID